MEESGCSTGNIKYYSKFPNLIRRKASPLKQLERPSIRNSNLGPNDRADRASVTTGCLGEGHRPGTKLRFENVLGKEERWRLATYLRPSEPEQVRRGEGISANFPLKDSRFSTTERLASPNRHVTSILPHSSVRSTPPLPTTLLQRRTPTDDLHAIRPLICPVRVCLGVKLGSRATAFKRHKSSSVPGRFPDSLPGQELTVRAGKNDSKIAGFTRLADQLGQEHFRALPGVGFPGNNMGHTDRRDKSSIQEGQKHPDPDPGNGKGSKLYLKEDSKPSGTLELCQLRNPKGPAPLPSSSTVLDSIQSEPPSTEASDKQPGSERSNLVDGSHESVFTSAQEQGNTLPNDGRSRQGLGSPTERDLHVGKLVSDTKEMAFQQKGDAGSISGAQAAGSPPKGSPHTVTDGQPYSGSIYQEGGRNEIAGTVRTYIPTPLPSRRVKNNSVSLLPARKIQRNCRPFIKRKSTTGVAPLTRGYGDGIQSMGYSGNRPIRLSRISGGQKVRLPGLQRSLSRIHRCLQSIMEVQTRMGISSSKPDSKSPCSLEREQGRLSISCSEMGKNLLDAGPSQQKHESPDDNSESGEGIDGLNHGQSTSAGRPTYTPSVEDWV